jgi:hypothetical protein
MCWSLKGTWRVVEGYLQCLLQLCSLPWHRDCLGLLLVWCSDHPSDLVLLSRDWCLSLSGNITKNTWEFNNSSNSWFEHTWHGSDTQSASRLTYRSIWKTPTHTHNSSLENTASLSKSITKHPVQQCENISFKALRRSATFLLSQEVSPVPQLL